MTDPKLLKPGMFVTFDVTGIKVSPYGKGVVSYADGKGTIRVVPHYPLANGMEMTNITIDTEKKA